MSITPAWRAVLDADMTRPFQYARDCSEEIDTGILMRITGLPRQAVTSFLKRNDVPRLRLDPESSMAVYATPAILECLRTSKGRGNHLTGEERRRRAQ